MASKTFNLSGTPDSMESESISVGSGERVRIRFTNKSSMASVLLVIEANGFTSTVPVNNPDAWVSDAMFDGDSVKILAVGGPCHGILESAA